MKKRILIFTLVMSMSGQASASISIHGASAKTLYDALTLPANPRNQDRESKEGVGFECTKFSAYVHECTFQEHAQLTAPYDTLLFANEETTSLMAMSIFDSLPGAGKVISDACGFRSLEKTVGPFTVSKYVLVDTGEVTNAELLYSLPPQKQKRGAHHLRRSAALQKTPESLF